MNRIMNTKEQRDCIKDLVQQAGNSIHNYKGKYIRELGRGFSSSLGIRRLAKHEAAELISELRQLVSIYG